MLFKSLIKLEESTVEVTKSFTIFSEAFLFLKNLKKEAESF